jgi:glucose/arabinose dehydrogenase
VIAPKLIRTASYLFLISFLFIAPVAYAAAPSTPIILEPAANGAIVSPFDVHMVTDDFSDPDPGNTHASSDWEIWTVAPPVERVWSALGATGTNAVHIHLADGTFEGSHAGRSSMLPSTDYRLRVRHRDNTGQTSSYAERTFRTSDPIPPIPGASTWLTKQAGYAVSAVATGFQLPVNIAFNPLHGSQGPGEPYFYVMELYGNLKVVTNSGTVSTYATGLLNFNPIGGFPGDGERGSTGVVVDPETGDLFVTMVYDAGGPRYPKVERLHSNDGGLTMATRTVILDMPNEPMGPSHQISNITIGPDGKLYVHVGDGFETATAQNLNSFRGKILRLNKDGSAPSDNPFYNAGDGITARDYVFAYGFRNPFGGAWRAADGKHYEVENGPGIDRFAQVVSGRNYLWDGTDASMRNFAIYIWDPATAPVNIAFVEPDTYNGSGFPAAKQDHAFVSLSGPTYAQGPQGAKRIHEFALDAAGNLVSGPTTLIEYNGTGFATVSALAAGPDGLYFSDLYRDDGVGGSLAPGANILRVKYIGIGADTPAVYRPSTAMFLMRNSNTPGPAELAVQFGPSGAAGLIPISGDWDGDGVDTPGLYDSADGAFFLTNSNAPGPADLSFHYGWAGPGLVPIAGDWNGDGKDSIGLYDPSTSTFFLKNTNAGGAADRAFRFGASGGGFKPIIGDWNGDNIDTIGIYSPASRAFFIKNDNAPGPASLSFTYGPPGATPLAGDWDGNGADSVGVYMSATAVWFLRNSNGTGPADISFRYGVPGETPLKGDWNGQ